MIPFNKPYCTNKEIHYVEDALRERKFSGNGKYTKKCQEWFELNYGSQKALFTSSCTDALEMCALLLDIKPGDEVIMPSYTFVSTANAFVLRGAKIVFVDSREDHPGMDEDSIESLINDKTRAIIVVHYAGVSCDMQKIKNISDKYNLFIIEDSAHSIQSYCKFENGDKKLLGSIGHLSTFSFHETKNITCGEGGMLIINDTQFINRAEILWEKGTNRSQFFRKEVNKYQWVDVGSSFLQSDILAAFLWGQIECINEIQNKRIFLWNMYFNKLSCIPNKQFILPYIPDYGYNNGHIFYINCFSSNIRQEMIKYLHKNGISSVFHYQGLHQSSFYLQNNPISCLPYCEKYSDCLLRLPLYYELTEEEVEYICCKIKLFFNT